MILVLLGYMGSGKSTIGKEMAERLNCPFYDLDDLIEDELECSISEIFETKGAIFFRKKESELLQKTIENNDNIILALGGGTPCYADNMQFLKQHPRTITIYLKWSLSSLVNRLQNEKEHRPLIQNLDNAELEEFIGKHLFERNFYYNQADHSIDCESKTINQIINEISDLGKVNRKIFP